MNHLVFCCYCERAWSESLWLFQGKKMPKWPRKLLLCIWHWWIPSRLSPGSPVGFIFQSMSDDRRHLSWRSALQHLYSYKTQFHEYVADLKSQVTIVFPWSDGQHQRDALHLLLQPMLEGDSSVSFATSKSFLPPVKQHLFVTSLPPGCIPRTCFRNTSILARPHLNTSVKTFSWTHFLHFL